MPLWRCGALKLRECNVTTGRIGGQGAAEKIAKQSLKNLSEGHLREISGLTSVSDDDRERRGGERVGHREAQRRSLGGLGSAGAYQRQLQFGTPDGTVRYHGEPRLLASATFSQGQKCGTAFRRAGFSSVSSAELNFALISGKTILFCDSNMGCSRRHRCNVHLSSPRCRDDSLWLPCIRLFLLRFRHGAAPWPPQFSHKVIGCWALVSLYWLYMFLRPQLDHRGNIPPSREVCTARAVTSLEIFQL